jgi:hypothetical protein
MIKTSRKSVWMIAKIHNPPIVVTKRFLSVSPKPDLTFHHACIDGFKKTEKERSDFCSLKKRLF